MLVLLFILIGSVLVGLLGRNRKFRFWGYFFASVLLTPFIGLLLVMASDPRPKQPVHQCPENRNSGSEQV